MGEPFDHSKWSFWLVAFVIAWLLVMAAVIVGACAYEFILPNPKACEFQGKFTELLTTILSSALAFAAGRTSK